MQTIYIRKNVIGMKKNTLKENIDKINKISKKFPKTINEAITFEHDDVDMDMDDNFDDGHDIDMQPHDDNAMDNMSSPINNASEKAKKLIDDIRKMSLRAMAELADTPEDENYIMLKKVWSMTDRKPEQDKNNGQQ